MVRWAFGALVLVMVAIWGTVGGRAQDASDPAVALAELEARLSAVERRLAGRPLGTPVSEGMRFEGAGDVVSESFALREGLVVVRIEAQGEGAVAATLYDGRGKAMPFGTKELPYAGSLADAIPEGGDYVLAVRSEGTWSVVLEQ